MGLLDMWDTFPVDFTHIHTDMKSLSTLDRFLISPGLVPHVQDAGALHFRDGDNPSRHSPIMIRIAMDSLPEKKPSSKSTPRRPAWYKADEDQVNMYTSTLSEKLASMEIPTELSCQDPHCNSEEHAQARDSFLLDILISMIETSYQTIPVGGGKRTRWDPDKNCEVDTAIPGWRKELEPLRQDSLFWHAMWLQSGKPNRGQLYEVMKHVRNKYHYAVKKSKKLADSVRAKKLFESAQKGDIDLLKEMKTIRGGNKQHASCPDNIDDASGPEQISELFKKVYEELYNSAESVEAMEVIKAELHSLINLQSIVDVTRVTGAAVKEACARMKPGK